MVSYEYYYEGEQIILSEVKSDILWYTEEHGEEILLEKVYNFEYNGLTFNDFYEYNNTEYTYSFIWCLYAIVYGIKMYDVYKEEGEDK